MRLYVEHAYFGLTQNKQSKNTTCLVGNPQRKRNQHCTPIQKFCTYSTANPHGTPNNRCFSEDAKLSKGLQVIEQSRNTWIIVLKFKRVGKL